MDQTSKKFVCTFVNCTASFAIVNKLRIHERTHTGERPFVCDQPECGKSYTSTSHLKRHVSTAHSEFKQTYKCPICFLTLSNLTNFKRHQARLHINGQKYPHQCRECLQGFYKKSQLTEHIFSHTQVAPFSCVQCSEGFLKRSMLIKHEKKCHTEYPCDTCEEIFYRWSDLLQHKKSEHKKIQKRFICDVCDKACITQIVLNKHKETHEKTRHVFVCPKENCDREYFYKRNLLQHIKTFHEGHVFKCDFPECEQELQTKQKLLQHKKMHERVQTTDDSSEKSIKLKKERAKRKDAGISKHSAIFQISGLVGQIPQCLENDVLMDSNITIENLMEISTA